MREDSAEFDSLQADATFRDFVCLYVAEGYKRNRNVVSLCNSDPAVVRLANRWICSFTGNLVDYGIQYHADQARRRASCVLGRRSWPSIRPAFAFSASRTATGSAGGHGGRDMGCSRSGSATPCSTRASRPGWIASGESGSRLAPTGRSGAWYRASFGERRSPVRIRPPRLRPRQPALPVRGGLGLRERLVRLVRVVRLSVRARAVARRELLPRIEDLGARACACP